MYLLDNALGKLVNDRPLIRTLFVKASSRQWIVAAQSGERQIFALFDAEAECLSLVEANAFLSKLVKSAFGSFYML